MVEAAAPSWMLVGVQKNRGDGGEFILAWIIWVHRTWEMEVILFYDHDILVWSIWVDSRGLWI